ncbi:hypothetical protein EBH_0005270 [Eimeria brunetti]|uniref:Uncharacterized protein n=1 Tax=Eimeria brunetti TaxID=51314 RepID=U6LRU9_9EIME|nr:hypothetical protein EBH_0005270 [Eimeria brunetti]
MGNHSSHPSVPLDGYLAVRASIEARFPPPPGGRQPNANAAAAAAAAPAAVGCWGIPSGEQQRTASGGKQRQQQKQQEQQQKPRAQASSARSIGQQLQEQGPVGGALIPPTLSVAETTDTNSDGAPDEFEAAAEADGAIGARSQSFTREKAPQVRAPSPLPFPSMAHCSPTVSMKAEPLQRLQQQQQEQGQQQQQQQQELHMQRGISGTSSYSNTSCCNSNKSSSNGGSSASRVQRVYAVSAFPSPNSRPKQLNAALAAAPAAAEETKGTRHHHRTEQQNKSNRRKPPAADSHTGGGPRGRGAPRETGVEAGAPEGSPAAAAAAIVQEEEPEMFCPLSPNSAIGSCSPPKKLSGAAAKTGGQQQAAAADAAAAAAASSLAATAAGNVSYGPACNHLPFLEGRRLQVLLPFLFGRSLGACMGVCVHWFMKISNGLAEMCAPIARGFEASCGSYLAPVSATVKLQALHTTQGNDFRMDWVITAKVLPSCANHVLSLGYSFKYKHPSSLNDWHLPPRGGGGERQKAANEFAARRAERNSFSHISSAHAACIVRPPSRSAGDSASACRVETPTFSVAVAAAGSRRRLWLHRDLCRFHGDETGQAVLTRLGPVCVGDFVEVPVVLSNGIGAAAVGSIRWLQPGLVRRAPRARAGPQAIAAALQGVYEACSLELQYVEWFDGDQYRHMTTERLKRAGN